MKPFNNGQMIHSWHVYNEFGWTIGNTIRATRNEVIHKLYDLVPDEFKPADFIDGGRYCVGYSFGPSNEHEVNAEVR